MAVKWLLHWQPQPGSTLSSQVVSEACAAAEALGMGRAGRWRTSLTFYRQMLRDQAAPIEGAREFIGLALHDHPARYFFVLRAHRFVLDADANIQHLMEKLQSYKARIVLHFEGFQYQLGDFQVRVGKCVPSSSETLRGIMMEVEYLPISSIEKSRQIMEEFVDIWQEAISKKSLPGHFMHIETNFAEYGLQDHYTPQHTAVQYGTCMAQLIAAVRN